MLSRRDKLLIQPWEDRRYKDHRLKVKSALPEIDSRAPCARPHVARKLRRERCEAERSARVVRDNFTLLQRLAVVMATTRLDNRWHKPPPNFQNKVGRYHEVSGARGARRAGARGSQASADTSQLSYSNARCYACEHKKVASDSASKLEDPVATDYDVLPFLYPKA
ncbi:PREDICTED: uncharacterized protein LOC106125893 [Papilio xuthus]|uniref:Uncharacterized protein LOC106125893 n=1 Tax=Papilio xuthus TaxID=66420 RepID=A0AAJ6ZT67_PAPXU|nr:PREDICTED: uncharacterized protein LOC106125893 [Papilio xuthus]